MRFFIETLSCRMSSIFEGAVYYSVEIYFFETDFATFWRPFGYKKEAEWMPTNLIQDSQKSRHNTEEDAPRSLSFTKRMRAHQREAEESVWNRRSVVFLLFLLVVVI